MTRVAVFGGDGRPRRAPPGEDVRVFAAPRSGGNGSLRRLLDAIRSGGVDRVVILARWNGHSATRRVVQLCRERRVPVTIAR